MKKIKFLIREVRRRTNTLDPRAISNLEVCGYFNDLQHQLAHFISRAGNQDGILQSSYRIKLTHGQNAYALPEDIQLCSAINAVYSESGGIIPRKNEGENGPGYFVRGGIIAFNKNTEYREVEIVYERRLNPLSVDIAEVDTITGNDILLKNVEEKGFYIEDDRLTLETTDGLKNFTIEKYDKNTTTITVEEDPSDVVVGSTILLGHNAVTKMALPDEVLPFMLRTIETYIRHRRNNTKFNVSLSLSEDEAQNLFDALAKPGTGVNYPVVLDSDYL